MAQQSMDYLSWSPVRKLTVADFSIRKTNQPSSSSFAQFSMQFKISGFDWMKKKLNDKVHNYFIRSASWIDTSFDSSLSLRYQQTLFDLCEIYTRNFRKELNKDRKKLKKNSDWVDSLNAKAMSDFAKRRLQYDDDTRSGTNLEKQLQWEIMVQKELELLNEYAVE